MAESTSFYWFHQSKKLQYKPLIPPVNFFTQVYSKDNLQNTVATNKLSIIFVAEQ